MCFSASASFIAGGALSSVGIVTIRKAKKKSELPFASIPLLFGVQQVIEGILWLAFHYHLLALKAAMTFLFSLFAYVLWPAFIPFAVRLLEPVPERKHILTALQFLGGMVGVYLLYFIVKYPVTSEVTNLSIVYNETVPFGRLMFFLYVVSGVGSCFVSSQKIIKFFGVALLIATVISYTFYTIALISVWCFFAAVLSVIILFYFLKQRKRIG